MSRSVVGVHWFLHDLRLHDNAAIHQLAAQCDQAVFIYVVDPRWFSVRKWGECAMGMARQSFLSQSLRSLNAKLQSLGQHLIIKVGDPAAILMELCQSLNAAVLSYNPVMGVDERRVITRVFRSVNAKPCVGSSNTLLRFEDVQPFLTSFPETFSKFHRWVQKQALPMAALTPSPTVLPPPILPEKMWSVADIDTLFQGGESAGLQQVEWFLWQSDHIQHYKETRNALDDLGSSSQLSPWLANGCLSVRYVAEEIARYHQECCRNESTEWLLYELWWREYFQWMLWRYGARLFAFDGIRQKPPLTTYYAEVFRAWQWGQTEYALVNACMNQLRLTGWLSNRGRQIVASAFVNELQLDWRWGAAWFEHALIDFDVASNYGNWQYLAGVGADPRGNRQFNLQKQQEYYDPSGEFRRKWLG